MSRQLRMSEKEAIERGIIPPPEPPELPSPKPSNGGWASDSTSIGSEAFIRVLFALLGFIIGFAFGLAMG